MWAASLAHRDFAGPGSQQRAGKPRGKRAVEGELVDDDLALEACPDRRGGRCAV